MSKIRENFDDLGTRMKEFERLSGNGDFIESRRPVCVRLDGVGFSKFTRSLRKPFDERMMRAMSQAAAEIANEFHPAITYLQSDEVTFLFSGEQQLPMGGRRVKLASRLAAQMTSWFIRYGNAAMPEAIERRLPHFDGRVIDFPDRESAAACLLWRELDARRNAVSSAASAHFSPSALHGKSVNDRLAMLADKGVDFQSYPDEFRSGIFLRRVTELRHLTEEEMLKIPPDHRPEGPVQRSRMDHVFLPPLVEIGNLVDVLFEAANPELRDRATVA